MTEKKPASMLGNMLMFLIVIMLVFQVVNKVSPKLIDFFAKQESLLNLISSAPLFAIILFALILSFYTNLFYKFGIPKETLEKMKAAKQENKDMQKKLKELRSDPEKMMKAQKEMMNKSMQNASTSMGTMFGKKFIFLVSVPSICFLFLIVGPLFKAAQVGYILNWGFSIFGRTGAGWLLTLILLSFILTPLTKKLLKLEF